MEKIDKIQQIKSYAKNQIDAEDVGKDILIIDDPKRAFIGLAVASQHPEVTVIFEGEAETAIIGLTGSSGSEDDDEQVS